MQLQHKKSPRLTTISFDKRSNFRGSSIELKRGCFVSYEERNSTLRVFVILRDLVTQFSIPFVKMLDKIVSIINNSLQFETKWQFLFLTS